MTGEYEIATGRVDITPIAPVALASYRAQRKPAFDSVADRLEANVVVIRERGEVSVFASLDLLYVGSHISEHVFRAFKDRVPRERIFLAATHTHSAPATEESLPALGEVSTSYRDFVARRLVELIDVLLNEVGSPATFTFYEIKVEQSVNRRVRRFGVARCYPCVGFRTVIAPNESGPRDDVVRALVMRAGNGRILAIGWSYACHPNTFPEIDSVSAEYPGRVREALREQTSDIPILFWQGFSGNINPYGYASGEGGGNRSPSQFFAPSAGEWSDWCDRLAHAVDRVITEPGRAVLGPIECGLRSLDISELGLKSRKQLVCRTISFGGDLAICGLSAEVVVEYVALARAALPATSVIPVSCIEDVFGYLPVGDMVSQGGYEADGFMKRFGLRGRFRRDVHEIVSKRLLGDARSD